MIPTTPLDVVNQALAELNQPAITSMSDPNVPAATSALRIFDSRRRYWLSVMLWNFSRWRGTCPLVPATPAFDFQNFYSLPTDFMALAQLGPDWRRFEPLWYDIQGQYICLNPTCPPNSNNQPWASLEIKYFRDVTDVSQWPAYFVDLIVRDMALRLCMPVTGDATLKKTLSEELAMTLKDAQAANHRDRPVIVTEVDPIARARQAGSEIWNLNINPSAWGSTDDQ